MKAHNLYTPYEIELVTSDTSPMEGHSHNFFEIVYILEGTGIQYVNKNKLAYEPGKMFLLMPQDYHSFEVHSETKFIFIRFNDIYLKNQDKSWILKLEYIFQNNNHLPGCILKNTSDKLLVKPLVEALVREQYNQQLYHHEVVQHSMNALITIAARNISFMMQKGEKTKDSTRNKITQELLLYIHLNIYKPEALKAEVIADHFNVSATYISEYFKKMTGENLQKYIIGYKIKLVETRLIFSGMRMNEIADELGFTDESHLNRIFKKYKGISPSEFRKHKI